MIRVVSWLSGGIASFIAAWLVRNRLTDVIFIDIATQTRDTRRFAEEAATLLGFPPVPEGEEWTPGHLLVLESLFFGDQFDVIHARRYINGTGGAPCTGALKRDVRKQWEFDNKRDSFTYVWGFDANEKHRINHTIDHNNHVQHLFPLAERGLSKEAAHAVCRDLGLRRADLYDMGYPNANCVGCVKGGMGYWNKIRIDFPEVFAEMAALEREIGATCLHDCNGKVWLDELDPQRGRCDRITVLPCGIACGVLEEWEQQEMEGY